MVIWEGFGVFLKVFGDFWWFLIAFSGFWSLLVIFIFLMGFRVFAVSWLFLVVFDGFFMVLGRLMWFLIVLEVSLGVFGFIGVFL